MGLWWAAWPLVALALLLLQLPPRTHAEQLCPSMDVRTLEDLERLRACTVVVGHVTVANLRLPPDAGARFSSALVEITDYLLVYRVQGLRSLGAQLLPRLVLVRGQALLHGRYVLAVFENRDLQDLGLGALRRLQAGSVRVEANPVLCFVDTVDWVRLLANATRQHFHLKDNQSPNFCPLCPTELDADADAEADAEPDSQERRRHCWSLDAWQRPPFRGRPTDCLSDCGPQECAGCRICPRFRLAGSCVEACNFPNFQMDKRECVRDGECRALGRIPHGPACLEACPPNYVLAYNGSTAFCRLLCAGHYVVQTAEDLAPLADCTAIRGSLTIRLKPMRTRIVAELERCLGNLKEITGFLRVTRSPQLVSLNFLPKLDTIGGTDGLIDDKYALYVVDNHHLEEIWAPNQKVAVLRGRVYFHLNPRLCHEKILQLTPSLKDEPRIGIEDASPNSNGERVICGSGVRLLNATVEELNATAARIKVDPMSADDKVVLIGYLHHYKEAPVHNVTMYDGRHGCGHDNWRVDISQSQNVRHIIANLRPFTQYAYFVKTLTMTEYHNQIDAYSAIQYFWTLPSPPGPVAKVYVRSVSSTELVVHWWPPKQPNGVVEKYVVAHELLAVPEAQNSSSRNYVGQAKARLSNELSCRCARVEPDPELSGPAPEDENYYNKEQITYDEALPNLIYVTRSLDAPKKSPTTDDDDSATTTTSPAETRPKRKSGDGRLAANQIEKSSKDAADPADGGKSRAQRNESEGEAKYHSFRLEMEMKALRQQDTGREAFAIVQPTPICADDNASVQFQVENGCRRRQRYKGTEVPGHQHLLRLGGLQAEATYLVSVRACVKGLENGCGREVSLLAKTLSRRMESFLRGPH